MNSIILCIFSIFISNAAEVPEGLLLGKNPDTAIKVSDVVSQIDRGSIVVISEIHDNQIHHDRQNELLNALANDFHLVSVGMEFFSYPDQELIDAYLDTKLEEADFLKRIGWGSMDFGFYRELVQFPISHQGHTYAINAPKWITRKIAKTGLDSLTDDEKTFLPPNFKLGNELYRERFDALMDGSHVPADALDRYFAAQSVWDDTMAWKIIEAHDKAPDTTFIVIVGDFHAAYGGGLPDRIRARSEKNLNLKVISQVDLAELTEEESWNEVQPHAKYGERADWVWVQK